MSCSALVPSHATLLTIDRTRTAGPLDCVIPRSSRVPALNHRGPSSCRPMQGSASSRLCLYFLFASPTSSTAVCPWPVCRPPSASLVFSLFPLPPLLLPNGVHGLQYRQSTTLLLQAGPFLVIGDPVLPLPHPTP